MALSVPSTATRRRLGEALVARGLVSDEQLQWALEVQARTGSRLGSILVASGSVKRLALYRALAEEWGVSFVDVTAVALDDELLARVEPSVLAREGWLPLSYEADGAVLVATCEEPTPARHEAVVAALGAPVKFAVTTDWDIQQGLRRGYREAVLEHAAYGLWRRNEDQSARHVIVRTQKVALISVLCGLAIAIAWAPLGTLVVLTAAGSLGFFAAVHVQVRRVHGRRAPRARRADHRPSTSPRSRDDELPMYTVLVPVYREANVVADLLDNLGQPRLPEREARDPPAARGGRRRDDRGARGAAKPPANVHVRDRARRHAEDEAEGVQRRPVLRPRRVPRDLRRRGPPGSRPAEEGGRRVPHAAATDWSACRPRSTTATPRRTSLTRMFTLEYSFWFDYMLPGPRRAAPADPARRHVEPLPHRRAATSSAAGTRSTSPRTPTSASGPPRSATRSASSTRRRTRRRTASRGNWIRQRSRWIKGYMQTLLVHLRHPVRAGAHGRAAPEPRVRAADRRHAVHVPAHAAAARGVRGRRCSCPPQLLADVFPGWVLWVSLVEPARSATPRWSTCR